MFPKVKQEVWVKQCRRLQALMDKESERDEVEVSRWSVPMRNMKKNDPFLYIGLKSLCLKLCPKTLGFQLQLLQEGDYDRLKIVNFAQQAFVIGLVYGSLNAQYEVDELEGKDSPHVSKAVFDTQKELSTRIMMKNNSVVDSIDEFLELMMKNDADFGASLQSFCMSTSDVTIEHQKMSYENACRDKLFFINLSQQALAINLTYNTLLAQRIQNAT